MRALGGLLAAAFAVAVAATGCEKPDNYLEGGLASQYDLSFSSVRARQLEKSRHLLIEYVRDTGTGEEHPITITIRPIPDGPGTFTAEDDQVSIGASTLPGQPTLPDVESAEVELEHFTPGEEGSNVEGSIGAMFTNTGTGDRFPLEGRFKADLIVFDL